MQSILQYRRLRREVQADLTLAQHAKSRTDSPISASTPDAETNDDKGREAEVEGKPELSEDKASVPGITVSRSEEGDGSAIFIVGWKENDASNPLNWPLTKRWTTTVACSLLAVALTIPSSVEGPTQDAFNAHFGVNSMAGSMTTGMKGHPPPPFFNFPSQ